MISNVVLATVVAATVAWIVWQLRSIRHEMRRAAELNRRAARQFRETAERWQVLADIRARMGDTRLAATYLWAVETHNQAADKLEEAAKIGESRQRPWWRRAA